MLQYVIIIACLWIYIYSQIELFIFVLYLFVVYFGITTQDIGSCTKWFFFYKHLSTMQLFLFNIYNNIWKKKKQFLTYYFVNWSVQCKKIWLTHKLLDICYYETIELNCELNFYLIRKLVLPKLLKYRIKLLLKL